MLYSNAYIYSPIYASRPTSTTVTHDRSPARGPWTYRRCLDLQPPFVGVSDTDDGSSGSGDGEGSPTSVSRVHELRAKHPGRVAQSFAWTVADCEGASTCLWIRRPAYGGWRRSLQGVLAVSLHSNHRQCDGTLRTTDYQRGVGAVLRASASPLQDASATDFEG